MSDLTLTQIKQNAGVVFTVESETPLTGGTYTFYANDADFSSGQRTVFWSEESITSGTDVTMPVELLQGFISNNVSKLRISASIEDFNVSQEMDIMSIPLQPTLTISSGNKRLLLTVTENTDTNSGNKCGASFNGVVTTLKKTGNIWEKYSTSFNESATPGVYTGIVSNLDNNAEYEIAVAMNNSVGQGAFSLTTIGVPSLRPQSVTEVNYDSSGNIITVNVPNIDVSGNAITAIAVKLVGDGISKTTDLLPLTVNGEIPARSVTFELTDSELPAGDSKTITSYLVASYGDVSDVTTNEHDWKSKVCNNDTVPMTLNIDLSGNVDVSTGDQTFRVIVDSKYDSSDQYELVIKGVDISGNETNDISSEQSWNDTVLTASFTISNNSILYNKFLKATFIRDNRDENINNVRVITKTLSDPIELFYLTNVNAFNQNIKPEGLNKSYTQTDASIAEDISNSVYTIKVTLDDNLETQVDASGTFTISAPADGWEQGKIYKSGYTVTKRLDANLSNLYDGHVQTGDINLSYKTLGEFIFPIGSKINGVKFLPTVTRNDKDEVTDLEFNEVLLSGDNNGASKESIRMLYANGSNGTLSDISFGEGHDGFDAMDGVDVFTEVSFALSEPIHVTDDDHGNVVFVTIQDDVGTLDNIVATRVLDGSALNIHNLKRAALAANEALNANTISIISISGELDILNSTLYDRTEEYNDASANKIAADASFNLATQGVVDASKNLADVIQNRRDLDYDINLYSEELKRLTTAYNTYSGDGSSSSKVTAAKDAMNNFPAYWVDKIESPIQETKLVVRKSLTEMKAAVETIGSVPDIEDGPYTMVAEGTYFLKSDALADAVKLVQARATIVSNMKSILDTATTNKSTADKAVNGGDGKVGKLAELNEEKGKTIGLTTTRTDAYGAFNDASPIPAV